MPLAEDIRDLADLIQGDLRAARDFYEHSKDSWRVVQKFAHAGADVEIQNLQTGAILSASDLDNLAPTYVRVHLARSVFKDSASLLEDWILGLIRLWLLAYPKGIPNKEKKPVPLADILEAADKDAILRDVVSREVLMLAYKRPADWFEYLHDRVDLGCPTADQIKDLAEIKATRDVLIHNRGIVNRAYLDKTGHRARFSDGERLDVPEPYLLASWRLIDDMVRDMAAAAGERAP